MPDERQLLEDALARLRSRMGNQNSAESSADRQIGGALATYQARAGNLRPWETQDSVRQEILAPVSQQFGLSEAPQEDWSGPIQLPGGRVVQIERNSARARLVDTAQRQAPQRSEPPPGVNPGFSYAGSKEGEGAARQAYAASDLGKQALAKAYPPLAEAPEQQVKVSDVPDMPGWKLVTIPGGTPRLINTASGRSGGSSEQDLLDQFNRKLGGADSGSSNTSTNSFKVGGFTVTPF